MEYISQIILEHLDVNVGQAQNAETGKIFIVEYFFSYRGQAIYGQYSCILLFLSKRFGTLLPFHIIPCLKPDMVPVQFMIDFCSVNNLVLFRLPVGLEMCTSELGRSRA